MKLFTRSADTSIFKNILLSSLFLALAGAAGAQAGPKLMGTTQNYGANLTGTIFNYTGGQTSLSRVLDIPVNPEAGPSSVTLTQAPNGKLYGLNTNDGVNGYGSVFKYDYQANTYTAMLYLDNTTGIYPQGSLLLAANGLLYGLTSGGDTTGGGTLFSYAVDSSYIVKLATLPANASPSGSLIQATNGKLYGLTQFDGTNGGGTIFQYDIAGSSYTVLYNLPANANPKGSLLEVGADTLYALTQSDGANGGGTLIRYVIGAATDTVLVNLPSSAAPEGSLMRASDGKLYAMTYGDGSNGFGTLFSYSIATGSYTDLHDFGAGTDAANPQGDLMQASDGKLYATGYSGGANSGGTIFQYDIHTGTYTQEFDFTTASGEYPDYGHLTEYLTRPVTATQPAAVVTCPGSTATFAASDSGLYATQWQLSTDSGTSYRDIPGATSDTLRFTASLSQTGYLYRAIFTNVAGADTSAAVSLTVNAPTTPTVSVSINTSDTICPNTSVTFTPATSNAGTPSYQWYLNGNPISSAQFYTNNTLSNGDSVWVVITGNAPCSATNNATSNIIHITVTTPVTPSVTVATGHSHTICAGTKITFTPTPTNGGSTPTYQWYLNGTAVSTSRIFVDSTLADQDSVWVVLTSSATCLSAATASSTPIHYVVNPIVTPSVSISSSIGDTICRNDQSILFATATNGGSNPSFQWVANGHNVGNSATYIGTTLLDGDVYYCILTSNASCLTQSRATSDTIRFTVHPYPAVTIGLTGGSNACAADSVGLSATGGQTYIWSDGETAASIFVPAGTYSVTATNSYGCTAGSNNLVAAPHHLLTDSLIRTGDTLTLAGTGGEFYQWYLNGAIISGAVGPEYIGAHTGDYQVSVIDSFGCRSSSAVVSIIYAGINNVAQKNTISIFPNPSSGMVTIDCGDDTPRQITISDELGRVVMTDISMVHRLSMDLSSLHDGIYFIQLSDGKTVTTQICNIAR